MRESIKKLRESFRASLPQELQEPFAVDCAQRNNYRFFFLPFLNILTQISCYFIYLHIYPTVYPEKPVLDQTLYLTISGFYIAFNVIIFLLLLRIRRAPDSPHYVRNSQIWLLSYLVFYIALESVETVMEVEISGNIYRFLATFFIVAFLPLVNQWIKTLALVSYTVLVEIGFSRLSQDGLAATNRYAEIVILFLIVCAAMSAVVYFNAVKSFLLRHELIEANRKLREMAVTDPLTGLSNRRAINDYICQVWNECKRNGQAVNALMIDIDWFKGYNDRYGHQRGDQCLVRVAAFLKGYFNRSTDMVGRYGGEEFIVLLPYTAAEGVEKLAEGIRRGIEELNIPNEKAGNGGRVTISVGAASVVPEKHVSYEYLVKLADAALYRAKEEGRNRVCFANLESRAS